MGILFLGLTISVEPSDRRASSQSHPPQILHVLFQFTGNWVQGVNLKMFLINHAFSKDEPLCPLL